MVWGAGGVCFLTANSELYTAVRQQEPAKPPRNHHVPVPECMTECHVQRTENKACLGSSEGCDLGGRRGPVVPFAYQYAVLGEAQKTQKDNKGTRPLRHFSVVKPSYFP